MLIDRIVSVSFYEDPRRLGLWEGVRDCPLPHCAWTILSVNPNRSGCPPFLRWFLSVHLVDHSVALARLMRLSANWWYCPGARL